MEITVVKEFHFEAAHFLPNHPGLCKNLHGHSYKLQIGVEGSIGDNGMVMDFAVLKRIVKEKVVDVLDHSFMNEIEDYNFPNHQPTAENMVRWIVAQLLLEVNLKLVRLWETNSSFVEIIL